MIQRIVPICVANYTFHCVECLIKLKNFSTVFRGKINLCLNYVYQIKFPDFNFCKSLIAENLIMGSKIEKHSECPLFRLSSFSVSIT